MVIIYLLEGRGGEGVEDFGSASQIFFRKLTANELPMRGGGGGQERVSEPQEG